MRRKTPIRSQPQCSETFTRSSSSSRVWCDFFFHVRAAPHRELHWEDWVSSPPFTPLLTHTHTLSLSHSFTHSLFLSCSLLFSLSTTLLTTLVSTRVYNFIFVTHLCLEARASLGNAINSLPRFIAKYYRSRLAESPPPRWKYTFTYARQISFKRLWNDSMKSWSRVSFDP